MRKGIVKVMLVVPIAAAMLMSGCRTSVHTHHRPGRSHVVVRPKPRPVVIHHRHHHHRMP